MGSTAVCQTCACDHGVVSSGSERLKVIPNIVLVTPDTSLASVSGLGRSLIVFPGLLQDSLTNQPGAIARPLITSVEPTPMKAPGAAASKSLRTTSARSRSPK